MKIGEKISFEQLEKKFGLERACEIMNGLVVNSQCDFAGIVYHLRAVFRKIKSSGLISEDDLNRLSKEFVELFAKSGCYIYEPHISEKTKGIYETLQEFYQFDA